MTAVPNVLVVTNDFPPRVGGVQQYVWNLVRALPAERVSVLAPRWSGAFEHDGGLAFPVERWPSRFLRPGPALARRTISLVRERGADVVMFGHGFPLPLLGPSLTAAGVPYVVLTHGAEVWQACVPGFAGPMRRALRGAATVTAVSRFTARSIRASLGLGRSLEILAPGVDERRFDPSVDGEGVRHRLGLAGRPVVACVSRLVPRKGQDVLIRAIADIRRLVPEAALLLVGAGPYRGELERLAAEAPAGSVVFAGEVAEDDLPAHHAAADVFAMPCRSRWGGLEVEGFGIVFLEAAATGRAVVAGRSGGAGEAIADGRTGLLVEGREPKAVALALVDLLDDPSRRSAFGEAGRARVEAEFTWSARAGRLAGLLADAAG